MRVRAAGDAGGRSGGPAGDFDVGGLSVCPPSLPGDGEQPPVVWYAFFPWFLFTFLDVHCFFLKVKNVHWVLETKPVSSMLICVFFVYIFR